MIGAAKESPITAVVGTLIITNKWFKTLEEALCSLSVTRNNYVVILLTHVL